LKFQLLERFVAAQVHNHLSQNGLWKQFQSGFRPFIVLMPH